MQPISSWRDSRLAKFGGRGGRSGFDSSLYLSKVLADAGYEAVYRTVYYKVAHIVLEIKKTHVMRLTT